MRYSEQFVIYVAGSLALHTAAHAAIPDSSGRPYSAIVRRNIFALNPAPPRVRSEKLTPTPLPKIVLTGIVKDFHKKQVFFKTPMSARPGEPPKETSFMLCEGERAGEIYVLEINEFNRTVRVKNNGVEQSLSLEKDGMKPTPFRWPGALPAAPVRGVPSTDVRVAAPSPEEQIVLMEINRKLNAEKVARGELPPLPNTPFTPKSASQ